MSKKLVILPSAEGRGQGIYWKGIKFCKSVCLSSLLCVSITPKFVETDPTYWVSLDHKFHGECHRHNFFVCLSGWLAVCLAVCLQILCVSITPKFVETDPTYRVSLDHKFHGDCHRHNFLSVCLSVCLSVF